jgi:hypothetical protein
MIAQIVDECKDYFLKSLHFVAVPKDIQNTCKKPCVLFTQITKKLRTRGTTEHTQHSLFFTVCRPLSAGIFIHKPV